VFVSGEKVEVFDTDAEAARGEEGWWVYGLTLNP